MPKKTDNEMSTQDAIKFACDLKKTLHSKGIWCTYIEECNPDTKFIKFEISIKVR